VLGLETGVEWPGLETERLLPDREGGLDLAGEDVSVPIPSMFALGLEGEAVPAIGEYTLDFNGESLDLVGGVAVPALFPTASALRFSGETTAGLAFPLELGVALLVRLNPVLTRPTPDPIPGSLWTGAPKSPRPRMPMPRSDCVIVRKGLVRSAIDRDPPRARTVPPPSDKFPLGLRVAIADRRLYAGVEGAAGIALKTG